MGYIGAGISRFNTVNGLSVNADGPTVTGIKDEDNMASNSAVKLATQQSIKAYVDSQIGANNELSEVLANGSTTGGNDISFGDNDKAIFGAGSDLQIYHDSATGRSYISESGPSAFFIQGSGLALQDSSGNNFIDCAAGSDVRLFHNASPKLATTSGGISVTGVVAATSYTGDGSSLTGINTDLVSDTTPQLGGNLDLNNSDVTGTGNINITGTLTSTGLDLNGNGDVSGNLVVNGLLMAVNGVSRTTANTQDALVFTTGEGLMKLNARGSIRYDIDNNANGTGQYHEFTTNDGGASLLKMQDSTGAVFNETGQDLDFRVESSNNTGMLFVNGGDDTVSVGTTIANATFAVMNTNGSNPTIRVYGDNSNGGDASIRYQAKDTSGNNRYADLVFDADIDTTGGIKILTDYAYDGEDENIRFSNSGIVINEGGGDKDFRVESSTDTHAFFVDAGASRVNMGTTGSLQSVSTPSNGWTWQGNYMVSCSNADTACILNRTSSVGSIAQFRYNGANKGGIDVSTSGTTYNTTSDLRLKTDIAPISDATDKLMAMNAVTHKWKAEPNADAVHGFIAQEMAEIVPEAVSGDPDGEEMMSMDYGRITPVIVAALQEATKKIAELETRIKELETK